MAAERLTYAASLVTCWGGSDSPNENGSLKWRWRDSNPRARVPLDPLPLTQALGPTQTDKFKDFGDLFAWPNIK